MSDDRGQLNLHAEIARIDRARAECEKLRAEMINAETLLRLIGFFGTEVTTRPQPEERQSTRTCRQAVTVLSFCLATNGRGCHP